ncbi:hypothetical protein Cantr_07569 [Candida viswanathii]|uniref:Uncharacterized protein n=1 Tax=Candida viswanathii TaxID=5486 RepID=A0A367Y0K9_9ASCO|nr:hypothetical protein Cantr_07569 [Candida viswanathii]
MYDIKPPVVSQLRLMNDDVVVDDDDDTHWSSKEKLRNVAQSCVKLRSDPWTALRSLVSVLLSIDCNITK